MFVSSYPQDVCLIITYVHVLTTVNMSKHNTQQVWVIFNDSEYKSFLK